MYVRVSIPMFTQHFSDKKERAEKTISTWAEKQIKRDECELHSPTFVEDLSKCGPLGAL